MKSLYFDYNATTPILPEIFEAMRPYLTQHFGNPSSDHLWGLKAKRGMEEARAQVAGLLGAQPQEIYFTSCATESNNMVLEGIFGANPNGRLVTTAVEHPAILFPAERLAKRGVKVTLAPVDRQGVVDGDALRKACDGGAELVSMMLANNETGAIQPVAELAAWARERGILVHTDASQAVGKIPVDVNELGVDFLTVAGHKLYAPKGVGALYVRQGVELEPFMLGGGQEGGLRPGTENLPYMAGLGAACQLAAKTLSDEMARQEELGRQFLKLLPETGVDHTIHSLDVPRLPNTLSVGFEGLMVGDILSGLVARDVAVSAGAACHGSETTISHVLQAMAVPEEIALGTIRVSWGRPTTQLDVVEMAARLREVVMELSRGV